MQLFDMIFWSTQNIKDQSQKNINYVTTKIAMFVNNLQPIVFAYLIYYFQGKLGLVSLIILIFYILVISMYTYYAYYKISYTLVNNNSVSQSRYGLHWSWNYEPYYKQVYIIYLLTIIILSYENLPNPFNIILAFIFLLSFLFSRYYFKGLSFGRWWCKVGAFIPIFFIMLTYFKIV